MSEAIAEKAARPDAYAPRGDYVIETTGSPGTSANERSSTRWILRVPRGCVYAFLGRNGSGKTTTIRMLLGLLPPTRGSARVLGQDCARLAPAMRETIGYMSESHSAYRWMKVREYARFQSRFYPKWNGRIFDAVIDHFQLSRDAKVTDLSRGEYADFRWR